jgi:hypothetical protein
MKQAISKDTRDMKLIVAIIFLCTPIILLAQDVQYKNGKCLTGDCENGYGTFEFASPKATYIGLFVNGSCEDEKATYENETYKYVGGYKNNRQNGEATIVFKQDHKTRAGDIFTGKIVDGRFYNGTYTYSNNPGRKQYTGEFTNNNNKFNGQGTLTYKDGKEQKGQWKDDEFLGRQIGVLYEQPVYWDMLNKVTTSKDAFDIEKENKYCCIKEVSSSRSITSDAQHIDKFKYFYIKKENGEVIAVVEIHDNYLGVIKGEVILNTDEKLLKHLNRNKYNKPTKEILTHIKDELYHDKNYCVWILFPEKYSVYHNPKGKWENLKFVRPEPNGNGSHETVLKVDASIIAVLNQDKYPNKITGTMILTGEYQQTYNFEHAGKKVVEDVAFFNNFWDHSTEDVQLHNKGWIYYVEFPQPMDDYAKPSPEEYNLARGVIGEYRSQVVTKSHDNPNKIFVSALNKEFDLLQQPRVMNEANYSESGVQDRLKTVRYYILYDKEGDNKEKECIGWVDGLSHTLGFGETTNVTFTENKGRISGLNFFGSIYIGDNNLLNADGTPNYDIPWQDDVDKAAWEHDKCYDALGEKGKWGVVSLKTKNCDDELSVACFSMIINNYNKNMLDNPSQFVETLNLLGFSKETVSRACKKIISGNNLFFGESPLKERALLTGFAFAGITNVKAIAKVVDNVITDYGEREVKKYDLLRSGEQTVTYDAPTTLVSTSGEKYEAQAGYYFTGTFKDGKIEQGNLYDPSDPNKKPVKTFFKKR